MVQFWKEGVELDSFVFFHIDLFADSVGGGRPVRPWFRGDQDDYGAKLAFRVRSGSDSFFGFFFPDV